VYIGVYGYINIPYYTIGVDHTILHHCTPWVQTNDYTNDYIGVYGYTNVHQCIGTPMYWYTNVLVHQCIGTPMYCYTNGYWYTHAPLHTMGVGHKRWSAYWYIGVVY
jgi:hypothetical protein